MENLSLFPNDVFIRRLAIGETVSTSFFPGEGRAVARAALRRRREFIAGRSCARLALAGLGVTPCAIPTGEGGMPNWPAGVVGSITHDNNLACAAVASGATYSSIGIDLTEEGGVSGDLAPLIYAADEVDRPCGLPKAADRLGLLFSAKESIYKCFYPLNRTFLDFTDLAIDWGRCDDERRGAYRAVFSRRPELWGRSRPIVGRWSIDRGRIYTSAYYRRCAPLADDDDR